MILSIHGIFTESPDKTVGKLKKYIKNLYAFNYGYIGVLGALWKNKSIAKDFAKKIKSTSETVTVIAYSNGNAIAVISAKKYGAEIKNLVCIGAALNRNIIFPEAIQNILVISTKNDKATKAARFFDGLPLIGCLVPDIWGSMGYDNYTGDDKRVTQISLGDITKGHDDYFNDEDLPELASKINNWLEKTG